MINHPIHSSNHLSWHKVSTISLSILPFTFFTYLPNPLPLANGNFKLKIAFIKKSERILNYYIKDKILKYILNKFSCTMKNQEHLQSCLISYILQVNCHLTRQIHYHSKLNSPLFIQKSQELNGSPVFASPFCL